MLTGAGSGAVAGGKERLGRVVDVEDGVGYGRALLSLTREATSMGGGVFMESGGGKGFGRCGGMAIAIEEGTSPQGTPFW